MDRLSGTDDDRIEIGKHAATLRDLPGVRDRGQSYRRLEADRCRPGIKVAGRGLVSASVVAEHHHHGDAPATAARGRGGPRTETASPGLCRSDATGSAQGILCFNVHKRWVYLMDRREFLEAIAGISALVPGLSLLPGSSQQAFAQGCMRALRRGKLTNTESAAGCHRDLHCGAPVAADGYGRGDRRGVNRFIDLLLTESMLEAYRDRFLEGLAAINARSQLLYGAPFISVRKEEQESLMRALDVHCPSRIRHPPRPRRLPKSPSLPRAVSRC